MTTRIGLQRPFDEGRGVAVDPGDPIGTRLGSREVERGQGRIYPDDEQSDGGQPDR